VNNTDLESDER